MRIKPGWIILAILVMGAGLRLWGIGFGLPYPLHQDEPIIVNHALAYGTGDLNPHFFIIPPLTSYILFLFYALYFMILKLFAVTGGAEAFAISFFKDPTPFYLIGRLVTGVIPGVINIYLTYRLALALFSRRAAVYAGLAMAVALLSVLNAHYIYTDTLLVTWALLVFLSIVSYVERPRRSALILTGIFCGAAIATKYNAAILLLPIVMSQFFINGRGVRATIKGISLILAAMAVAFVVCNPYSLLDSRFFLNSVTGRIGHGYMGFSHHIAYSLFEGMSALLTITGFFGLCLALSKKAKQVMPVLAFIILFYIHLIFASQPYPRYVLVLVPFLCAGAGFFFDFMFLRFRQPHGKVLVIVAAILALVPTAMKSVLADSLLCSQDTRISALQWIEQHIPAGGTIALDHTFFGPPLRQTRSQLEDKQVIFTKQPELAHLKDKKLEFQIKALGSQKTYQVYYMIEGSESAGQFLNFWPVVHNTLEDLRAHGVQYVIFNSTLAPKSMRALRQKIGRGSPLIAEFNPYWVKIARPFDNIEFTCLPIGTRELFSRKTSGPGLEIYKIEQ